MIDATTFHTSKHLFERDLGPVQESCLFCDSRDLAAVAHLQSEPDVHLLNCRSCGVCSASRLPTVDALKDYYEDYYQPSGNLGPAPAQVTFDNPPRLARHLARVLRNELKIRPLRILDFGGGDGAIALHMAEDLVATGYSDISITIVEYHEKTVRSTSEAITIEHHSELEGLEAPAAQFDVVIASAIIEHLPDAKTVTERLLGLLRPEGIIYVRTPYVVPVLRLMGRFGLGLDFTFPGHIHDMGQDFWEVYFSHLSASGPHRIVRSHPSIVETGFRSHFLRTLVAHLVKWPWQILGRRYRLVGGWEIFVQKKSPPVSSSTPSSL